VEALGQGNWYDAPLWVSDTLGFWVWGGLVIKAVWVMWTAVGGFKGTGGGGWFDAVSSIM
jgi:hypothetical protein